MNNENLVEIFTIQYVITKLPDKLAEKILFCQSTKENHWQWHKCSIL